MLKGLTRFFVSKKFKINIESNEKNSNHSFSKYYYSEL